MPNNKDWKQKTQNSDINIVCEGTVSLKYKAAYSE